MDDRLPDAGIKGGIVSEGFRTVGKAHAAVGVLRDALRSENGGISGFDFLLVIGQCAVDIGP